MDTLSAVSTLCDALRKDIPANSVVVSPDEGRVRMASDYAQRLGASVVVLHKQRQSGTTTSVTHVVGDVRGSPCLIVDDMISTGGTIAKSVAALLEHGAPPEITVAAVHGVLVEDARRNLSHEAIRKVIVTDTIAVPQRLWPALEIVSVAPLLAATVQRLGADESLGDLLSSAAS